MEWGEPQLPGLVDKGTALVSDYKNEAQIPRPDDFTEALRTTVPVSEALGKGQDVALRREEWPEDFGPFGEDREEEFLAALAKLTYHLKRGRDEQCRPFFARWDGAVKKIQEHNSMWCYPKRISGNSVALTESDIKGMLSFTQGFIAVKDVKSWCRKHEMKLLAKEVGVEKTRTGNSTASEDDDLEDDDLEDDELLAKEELLREPRGNCPQTIRVSVRRHAKGGLSADNRGKCPQTLTGDTVRRQSG